VIARCKPSWLVGAGIVIACNSDSMSVGGEIRGMPPATTAYTWVYVVPEDSIRQKIQAICDSSRSLQDETPAVPKSVSPQTWRLVEAEEVNTTRAKCLKDDLRCGFSNEFGKQLVHGILIPLAKGEDVGDAPEGFVDDARRLRQRAIAIERTQFATDSAAHAARMANYWDSTRKVLVRYLHQLDPNPQRVRSDGGFRVSAHHPGSAVTLAVERPDRIEIAIVPIQNATDKPALPYDSATFGLLSHCTRRATAHTANN
jgi:hypothetical protein